MTFLRRARRPGVFHVGADMSASELPASRAKAGFSIREWCPLVGLGVSTLYTLPTSERPHTVKLRGRVIVIESPADYLSRISAQQRECMFVCNAGSNRMSASASIME